uniref:Transposase Helix-turn-helix domain-containing protein n=1 Tax=Amphimedon queenslandica TaxID=400682 RepID=A0A1X7UCB2_AMPQE
MMMERILREGKEAQEDLEKIRLSENVLQNDQKLLKFYTGKQMHSCMKLLLVIIGLHEWSVFMALFNLIQAALPRGIKLSQFHMVIMFLMKLRLHLEDEDLAQRYSIASSTVSRNFNRILEIMYIKTKPLIKWPEREVLRSTIPYSFRKFFKNCALIVDCTEVFIENPSDLQAKAQVWSN